ESLAGCDACFSVHSLREVAVPDVAGRDRDNAAFAVPHFENDVDVLLAASADAKEADAQVFIGAVDAVVAGGGESEGSARGHAGFHKVSTIDGFGHGEDSGIGSGEW